MHRGIYINDLYNKVLEAENSIHHMLHWCFINGFNAVYLYNIGKILKENEGERLNQFLKIARTNYPNIDITFVSAGFNTSFDHIENYLQKYTHPDGIVSEIEFWNNGKTFEADYLPWLKRLDELKFNTSNKYATALMPDLKKRFYIGKIKDSGQPANIQIARSLIRYHDEIFLANYHTDAYHLSTSKSTNSIRNRLRLLAQAGKELSQKVNISIIFSVYQNSPSPHIWDYFAKDQQNHAFEEAFKQFKIDFEEAKDIRYKEMLNLIGYSIYRYTDAYEARS